MRKEFSDDSVDDSCAYAEMSGFGDRPEITDGVFAIFNARLIKETFSYVAQNEEHAMNYFYSRLFLPHPDIRAMFPLAMDEHMHRVYSALARLVWSMDSPAALDSQLAQLGRDHRKFGVKAAHCDAFFDTLLATVRHFSGHYWTSDAEAAWRAAIDHASALMQSAAASDAERQPPWWTAEVVQHDQRTPSLAVLTMRPGQPLSYAPGQYLAAQVPRWPRVWRNFSIANAPRENGLIDLHVRAVPGGMVSNALVHHTRAGDTILLGPARGEMTLHMQCQHAQFPHGTDSDDPHPDLLCIAGGTGLAPIKAIIQGVIDAARNGGRRRNISLFVGARSRGELYDMRDLEIMQSAYPALTVTPVVSHEPGFDGLNGKLPAIVRARASCTGREIFISGPDPMVRGTAQALARRASAAHIHYDPPDAPR
jgi:NAD(P)H-flavin reductase/hemoglobin-like flavoprotein